jgi:hypothetical protein
MRWYVCFYLELGLSGSDWNRLVMEHTVPCAKH